MKTTHSRFCRVTVNARTIGVIFIGLTLLQSEFFAASTASLGESPTNGTTTFSREPISKPTFIVKEESIGTLDAGVTADAILFSPDGKRFAYKRWDGNKPVAVIDGHPEKAFENIFHTTAFAAFSADSRHVAFPAQRGGKWFVVVDGVEGRPCDEVKHLSFVPGSSAVAYLARFGEEWCPVVNGIEGKRYDYVGKLHFNPNGSHHIFSATIGKTKTVPNPKAEIARLITYIPPSIVVLDGKQTISDGTISQYLDSDEIAFSADSKHYAYVASLGPPKKLRLVVDGVLNEKSGVAGKEYQDIRYLTFSSDGSRLAYWAITRETNTKEC
ncbi:MAG: hypothetical protein KIS67_23840 [Verrucomicrobiae bacterium]|nr:hypothetical protein [Verrucomicrobiae bacterium]